MREVVGVAVLEGRRVLAARRSGPPEVAGLWEFPGGKVEPGEDPQDTATREIREELGCGIVVTGWLEGTSVVATDPAGESLVLRVATARLSEGDPVPTEHDAVRWLDSGELETVTWTAADVPFLAPLQARLGGVG